MDDRHDEPSGGSAGDGEPAADGLSGVVTTLFGSQDTIDKTVRTSHGPVTDFATDFDHTDAAWAADPFPIWDDLRERCPIAHSGRYGGSWLPVRHEDVAAIAYDTDRFTSRSVLVNSLRPTLDTAPRGIAPPITSDPPFHAEARRMLLPAFSPPAVARLEGGTRELCTSLLDALEGRDVVDAAVEYAQHIPVRVITRMLGFPDADAVMHLAFVHQLLENVDDPLEERILKIDGFAQYLVAQIADHAENPRDDLTSYLLACRLDGEPLDLFHIGGTMALLLLAGIDTTWSAIGSSIWHLASHPQDRTRLVDDPDLLPTAIEEFLRAYAPVTMARLVTEDMEWRGCPMKADDWVLLPFPAANRDPEVFERADEVLIDRAHNRHAAFGLGIHRCIGSNLARMELRVALECWLERYPEFTLEDPESVSWSGGQIRGPRILPLRVTASAGQNGSV
jgi:cytochrome P450